MKSVVERALGSEFSRLHPKIQRQYGITSEDRVAWVGRGVMEEIWRGPYLMVPFLWLGSKRRVMFTETGRDVPFTVENYAYQDRFGRETLTWIRTFDFKRQRRFDETLIYSEARRGAVVYAGTHQHLAVELHFSVGPGGTLRLRTGTQRLYEWRVSVRFPQVFSGTAIVEERYSEERGRFEVDVDIRNRIWGRIFGYRGWFELEERRCSTSEIPPDARPRREERRE